MRRRRGGLPPSPDSLKKGYHGGDDPFRWERHESCRDAENLAGRFVGRARRMADAGPGRPGGGAIPDAPWPDAHAPSHTHPHAGGIPDGHCDRCGLADADGHPRAHVDADGDWGRFADPHRDGRPDRVADARPVAHGNADRHPLAHADACRGRRRAASPPSAACAARFGHRQRRDTGRGPPHRSPAPHRREPGRATGGRRPRAVRPRDRPAASAIRQKPPGLSGPGATGVSKNAEMVYNQVQSS